ncbi:MAG: hypothetical protein JXQ80_11160, partial [Bacteroidales bacterium]|nr:hypothetical protein [Bacteroidales bacterium]
PYNDADRFCAKCGYPLQGTTEEQQSFSSNYALNKLDEDNVRAKVGQARLVLFLLAGFTAISAAIVFAKTEEPALLGINLILAVIYAGLGFWAANKAFAAIFTGALIYLSIILLNGIVDPMTLLQGIIFKIIFIVAFVKASYGAYKYKINQA